MSGVGGDGILILVVGPSGAGKDTLIRSVRDKLGAHKDYRFPRRFITRDDQTGEDHIPVTPVDFDLFRSRGEFFLSWEAHGLSYGLPIAILKDLQNGRCVIVNVSRQKIVRARELWPKTEVISISVDAAVLRMRLKARGREAGGEIDRRLARATDGGCDIPAPYHSLDNSGFLEESAAAFLKLVLGLAPQREPFDDLKPAAAAGFAKER